MLSVLDGVEAKVQLGKQRQHLNELKLLHFADLVQAQVQEPQTLDVLKALQPSDLVPAEVQGPKGQQLPEPSDFGKQVVGDIEFLEEHACDVIDLGDLVGV